MFRMSFRSSIDITIQGTFCLNDIFIIHSQYEHQLEFVRMIRNMKKTKRKKNKQTNKQKKKTTKLQKLFCSTQSKRKTAKLSSKTRKLFQRSAFSLSQIQNSNSKKKKKKQQTTNNKTKNNNKLLFAPFSFRKTAVVQFTLSFSRSPTATANAHSL